MWWAGEKELERAADHKTRDRGRGTCVPMGGGRMSPQGVWTVVEGRSQVFIKMPNPLLGGW